jgi:lipid-A-disaccharide synthase
VARTEELSVMGFTEVLGKLWTIRQLWQRIGRALEEQRPDAVVLIDAPSFNFRVARMAKALGLPVVYYISPKLWAWRQGRAKFIKQYVDRMVCIFPFEPAFYARFGVKADYVGHPLLPELARPELDAIVPDPHLVGILPGSRRSEIESLTPVFGAAAELLFDYDDKLRFVALAAPTVDPARLRALWPERAPLEILGSEDRYAHMRRCSVLLAASGTVSMETALLQVPTIIAYKLSPVSYFLAKRLAQVSYVSLPNIILDRAVFPEYLQHDATPANLAAAAKDWLESPPKADRIRKALAPLRELLGPPGAVERAAGIIINSFSS